jgi:hypothetical protein
MDSTQIPQAAASVLMDSHVQTAIWAIFTAVAFTLVLILSEMLKQQK